MGKPRNVPSAEKKKKDWKQEFPNKQVPEIVISWEIFVQQECHRDIAGGTYIHMYFLYHP